MNNDNEKDLPMEEASGAEIIEAPSDDSQPLAIEDNESILPEEEDSSCGCCDCSQCDGCAGEAPLANNPTLPKKQRPVMFPVIIAAIAVALVAAIVFGGITVYNAFFGTSLKGVWVEEGYEDSGIYFEFDDNGNVYLKGGGISYFGTYKTATYDVGKDTELPEIITSISETEALSGKVNVLTTDFYMFGANGGEYVYSLGSEDGAKTATVKFVDSSGAVAQWKFIKSKLPEFSIDPEKITNASADEAGVTTLKTDKNIIGTWSEADYGTYTFYEDGTANYKTDYQIDQSYQLFYGVTMGYGVDLNFKYTVDNGNIYMSVDYYSGETSDGVMTYYLDGTNLVIDGVGYAKTDK